MPNKTISGGLLWRSVEVPDAEEIRVGIVSIHRLARFVASYGMLWFTDAALVFAPPRGGFDKVQRIEYTSMQNWRIERHGFFGVGAILPPRPALAVDVDGVIQLYWGAAADISFHAHRWLPDSLKKELC